MLKRTVALLIACLALVGCGRNPQNTAEKHYTFKVISYFRDTRTDVCFAVVESYYGGEYRETTTTVSPCTEKVIALTKIYSNE
jgi:hypothetical protein